MSGNQTWTSMLVLSRSHMMVLTLPHDLPGSTEPFKHSSRLNSIFCTYGVSWPRQGMEVKTQTHVDSHSFYTCVCLGSTCRRIVHMGKGIPVDTPLHGRAVMSSSTASCISNAHPTDKAADSSGCAAASAAAAAHPVCPVASPSSGMGWRV